MRIELVTRTHDGPPRATWCSLAPTSSPGLRQNVVSCSSVEVEYRAVANGVVEACWLWQLLQELHAPLMKSTLIYCDNVNAVYLSTNPMKHVEIDLHFVRERVAIGDDCILHVPMSSQFAVIFMKGLLLLYFRSFGPVSTFAVARVSTVEGIRKCVVL
jgi:hypothetical protein